MTKVILTVFFALYSTPDGVVHKTAKIMPSYETCLMVMANPKHPDITVLHQECKLVEFEHPQIINKGAIGEPDTTQGAGR